MPLLDVTTNLQVHYRFDAADYAGGVMADHSGHGRNMTMTGAPSTTPGQINEAISFDGATQFGVCPYAQSTGAITLMFWVKVISTSSRKSGCFGIGTGEPRFSLILNVDGVVASFWDCGDLGTGNGRVTTTIPNLLDQWVHIAVVSAGGGGFQAIYVNGAVAASSPTSGLSPNFSSFDMGQLTGWDFFTGLMDDFRIYNEACSVAKIKLAMRYVIPQAAYYLNPTTGNDANNGLTALTAFKNISKVNNTFATITSSATLHIDTTGGALTMDEQLVIHDQMAVVGTGNISFTGTLGRTISGLADLRAYKAISNASWSKTAGHTNIYQTSDTEPNAYLWRFVDWPGHSQPLQMMTHVTGSSFTAVATVLDSANNQFYTDGTTMYMSLTDTLTSLSFVRSTPSLMTSAAWGDLSVYNANSSALQGMVYLIGSTDGNMSLASVAAGGGAQEGGDGTLLASYSITAVPVMAGSITVSSCLAYMGSYHSLGVFTGYLLTSSGSTSITTINDTRWEPTVPGGISGIVFVGSSSGHTLLMNRCNAVFSDITPGSTEGMSGSNQALGGHGFAGGFGTLSLTNCEFGSNGNATQFGTQFAVTIDTVVGSLVMNGGITSNVSMGCNCVFTGVMFNNCIPGTNTVAAAITLTNCQIVPLCDRNHSWIFNNATFIAGSTLTLSHCVVDASKSSQGDVDNHSFMLAFPGTLTLSLANNVFKTSSITHAVALVGGITAWPQPHLTLTADYNAYANLAAAGVDAIFENTFASVYVYDNQLKGDGLEAHGQIYNGAAAYSVLKLSAGNLPYAGSPLIKAAGDGGNIGLAGSYPPATRSNRHFIGRNRGRLG